MYSYDYDFNPDYATAAAGVAGVAIVFIAIFLIIALAIGITIYVFESLAFYTIAKNRGIQNPWLAWIPFANYYLIGEIADYYTVREGKQSMNFRIWLLVLSLCLFVPILNFVAGIALLVLTYISLYKIYKNIAPNNAVLYLILSILFSIAMPVILFIIRNKPDVTPAVQYQPPYGQTTYGQPQQPYGQAPYGQPQQPYGQPQQTQYQPPQQTVYQPPVEPQGNNNVPPQQ